MLAKEVGRIKRHRRIRKKVFGTPERPRLSVHRSLKNLYVQAIDDIQSKTLVSFTTDSKVFKKEKKETGKVSASKKTGQLFAEILKRKGIKKVAFDRSGYLYHGRVKALADSLREAGIEF